MTSNNTPSHEPDGQQAAEAETDGKLIERLKDASREELIDIAVTLNRGVRRLKCNAATPQPTERDRIVAWLRDLPEDEWYPRHVADAIERGDYLASDPG